MLTGSCRPRKATARVKILESSTQNPLRSGACRNLPFVHVASWRVGNRGVSDQSAESRHTSLRDATIPPALYGPSELAAQVSELFDARVQFGEMSFG